MAISYFDPFLAFSILVAFTKVGMFIGSLGSLVASTLLPGVDYLVAVVSELNLVAFDFSKLGFPRRIWTIIKFPLLGDGHFRVSQNNYFFNRPHYFIF